MNRPKNFNTFLIPTPARERFHRKGGPLHRSCTNRLVLVILALMRRVRLRIKEVAESRHISIRKLHYETDIALSRVKQLLRDPYAEVKLGTLARIADALECSICELFEEFEE